MFKRKLHRTGVVFLTLKKSNSFTSSLIDVKLAHKSSPLNPTNWSNGDPIITSQVKIFKSV